MSSWQRQAGRLWILKNRAPPGQFPGHIRTVPSPVLIWFHQSQQLDFCLRENLISMEGSSWFHNSPFSAVVDYEELHRRREKNQVKWSLLVTCSQGPWLVGQSPWGAGSQWSNPSCNHVESLTVFCTFIFPSQIVLEYSTLLSKKWPETRRRPVSYTHLTLTTNREV